jgi:hypothetical protein
MAVLTADQIRPVFSDGQCQRTVLYALKNVDASDTFDIGGEFRSVKRAGMVSDTGSHIASVNFTGVTGTIPTGPSDDGVWLMVVGVSV